MIVDYIQIGSKTCIFKLILVNMMYSTHDTFTIIRHNYANMAINFALIGRDMELETLAILLATSPCLLLRSITCALKVMHFSCTCDCDGTVNVLCTHVRTIIHYS